MLPPPKPPKAPAPSHDGLEDDLLLSLPKPPLAPAPERAFVLPEGCDQVLHLMGATTLSEFLAFVRERVDLSALRAEGAASGDPDAGGNIEMDLTEFWRDAAAGYRGLADIEAYPAELPGVFPLPGGMQAHCNAFLATSHVQREFNQVPVALGMVPLAHLIAVETRLNMTTIAAHSAKIPGGSIADIDLATLCLPLQAPLRSLQLLEKNGETVTFASDQHDQHDLRLLQARVASASASEIPVRGHVSQTLALDIGFPGNVLNVIRFENRLILNNGYHRALALLKRGVTHVPAVIQMCRDWDDVAMLGNAALHANVVIYVERPRPPLLRDFVDPLLCMSLAVPRVRQYLRIRYQVETGFFKV